MATLYIKLRQHSPIIHFQHDQDGATLRASEVKPKLDRFIMGRIINNPDIPYNLINTAFKKFVENNPKYKNWLIGKGKAEHTALDYKIKIQSVNIEKNFLIAARTRQALPSNTKDYNLIAPSPFFAIEKDIKLYIDSQYTRKDFSKMGVFSSEQVNLTINALSSDLIETINNSISDFFLSENFGTRQSKGFGSFTFISNDPKDDNQSNNFIEKLNKLFDCIYIFKEPINFENGAFEQIQNTYSILKSGINNEKFKLNSDLKFTKNKDTDTNLIKETTRGTYIKSKLFLRAVTLPNEPLRWEKRKIKILIHRKYKKQIDLLSTPDTNSACFDNTPKQSWEDPPGSNYNYRFVRALLGLNDKYDFFTKVNRKNYTVNIKSNNSLKRFQSPILFKIIDNHLYLLANEISRSDLELLSKKNEFIFFVDPKIINELKKRGDPLDKGIEFSLTVPDNISIIDFLDFAMKDKTNDFCLGDYFDDLKQPTTNER